MVLGSDSIPVGNGAAASSSSPDLAPKEVVVPNSPEILASSSHTVMDMPEAVVRGGALGTASIVEPSSVTAIEHPAITALAAISAAGFDPPSSDGNSTGTGEAAGSDRGNLGSRIPATSSNWYPSYSSPPGRSGAHGDDLMSAEVRGTTSAAAMRCLTASTGASPSSMSMGSPWTGAAAVVSGPRCGSHWDVSSDWVGRSTSLARSSKFQRFQGGLKIGLGCLYREVVFSSPSVRRALLLWIACQCVPA